MVEVISTEGACCLKYKVGNNSMMFQEQGKNKTELNVMARERKYFILIHAFSLFLKILMIISTLMWNS